MNRLNILSLVKHGFYYAKIRLVQSFLDDWKLQLKPMMGIELVPLRNISPTSRHIYTSMRENTTYNCCKINIVIYTQTLSCIIISISNSCSSGTDSSSEQS